MLLPLDVIAEPVSSVPAWPLILLAIAGAMVVFFLIVQLRRIVRRRPRGDVDPE
ncbi:MAG: hypothetical protein Q4G35_00025 [Propionibacteriaceae bacterium]|nr:hypothetical protein [Propionibacteriaceae bacterium]